MGTMTRLSQTTSPLTSLTKVLRTGLPLLIDRATGGTVRQVGHGEQVITSPDGEDAFQVALSNGCHFQISVKMLSNVIVEAAEVIDGDFAPWEGTCRECGTITDLQELDGQGTCTGCAGERWDLITPAERTAWCKAHHQHYPYEDKGPMSPEQLAEVALLLEAHPFRFATTTVKNPHWYTLRHEWADVGDEVFNDVVRKIREHGVTEWFGTYPWRMLYVNGFKYWTYYSSFVEEVIVLNRKPIGDHNTIPDGTESR
jgi:hypothetical protein